jgi:SnoaL-like domain
MTHISEEAITGREGQEGLSPVHRALVGFYRAFNERDVGLMAKNWLQSPDASMSNPLGGIKRGWDDIRTVYDNIFNGPAQVYVEYHDYSIFETGEFFQAVGRERGRFSIDGKSIDLRIRTSRTFVKQGDEYRQLHHHGSIEEPELLHAYQTGVRTGKLA